MIKIMVRSAQILIPLLLFLLVSGVVAVGCGENESSSGEDEAPTSTSTNPTTVVGETVVAGESEFGEVLFSSDGQAMYRFENDSDGETTCYGECAEAWPPVIVDGQPTAGPGADGALLGTIERRDGSTQLTYAGRPMYFYANEGPDEVRCHNITLHGGLWLAVKPDGDPAPT